MHRLQIEVPSISPQSSGRSPKSDITCYAVSGTTQFLLSGEKALLVCYPAAGPVLL